MAIGNLVPHGKARVVALVAAGVVVLGVGAVVLTGPHRALAQFAGLGPMGGMHQGGFGPGSDGHDHGHGTGLGGGHDMAGMPGLRGRDATPEESAELAVMFNNFQAIDREVSNLPNGIRTVTVSSDPQVMAVLVSHVAGMIQRVEDGRDPGILIQSPTLDILFERGDRIVTDIEVTDEGIVVTQTSDDAEVVAALQTHAAEVTDLAARGMVSVHEAMARRAAN